MLKRYHVYQIFICSLAVALLAPLVGTGLSLAAGSGTKSRQAPVAEHLTVDWSAARQHPRLELNRLSIKQRQAVQDSAVPVLLPDREALLRSALITTGPGWYAASMTEDQTTIAISGNAKVIRIPGVPEPPEMRDPALKPSASETGLEVNFKAFGIYYNISVECYDPNKDPHCTDSRFLMQLVDSLKLALIEK